MKKLITTYPDQKIQNVKFEYFDALSLSKVSSTTIQDKLEAFETLDALKIIIPDFKEFDSETYLGTIHSLTPLSAFSDHVQSLKKKLREGKMNQNLKVQVIKDNFDIYYQARRVIKFVQH